jgi:hypothetical protein
MQYAQITGLASSDRKSHDRIMRKLGIAGLQLDLRIANNIERIGAEIRGAKARMPWLDLFVLSELCAYGPDIRHAEKREDPAEQAFCRFAKEAGVWLIPGSLFVEDNGSVFNEAARGWNGLGQVLKSFRDTRISFPQYATGSRSPFLGALGPLALPKSSLPQR